MPDMIATAAPAVHRPALLSVTAAAAELGVSRSHVYQLRARGLLGFARCAGRTVVPRSELDRLIGDLTAQATAERGAAQ